jgi:hypothetical protein
LRPFFIPIFFGSKQFLSNLKSNSNIPLGPDHRVQKPGGYGETFLGIQPRKCEINFFPKSTRGKYNQLFSSGAGLLTLFLCVTNNNLNVFAVLPYCNMYDTAVLHTVHPAPTRQLEDGRWGQLWLALAEFKYL